MKGRTKMKNSLKKNLGNTDKKFDCKKDCIISYNAVLSYIN